jgi:hypothetical protein
MARAITGLPRDIVGDRLILGFCGPEKSGKTLSAHYLVNNYGFERVRFAEPCEAMMRALGLTHDEIKGTDKDQPCAVLSGKTPAQAMQVLGTEWSRELVNAWRRAIAPFQRVVVDDCRFLNEAAAIQLLDGILIGIKGRGVAMEAESFIPDMIIDNSGSPTELCDKLDALVEGLRSNTVRNAA